VPIPVKGSGNPLPPNFPIEANGYLRPRMFLYFRTKPESRRPSNAPSIHSLLNENVMDWCFGFDSEQLATALNITTDSLFQAKPHRS